MGAFNYQLLAAVIVCILVEVLGFQSANNRCISSLRSKEFCFSSDVIANSLQSLNRDSEILFVESEVSLQNAVNELSTCKEIGLDLEFDRDRYAYGFTLCLIQAFGNGKSYVFDPFKLPNLQPLYNIFENQQIMKILHAPNQDLDLLHLKNCYPVNIFDTESAAKLLGVNQTLLSFLLSEYINIKLDKSSQTSNWYKRPLSNKQINYAANDVKYLISLRDSLLSLASTKNYNAKYWIECENKQWDFYRENYMKKQFQFLNNKEIQNLAPYQCYILNEVKRVRDKYAKDKNRPSYQMISKDLIMDIAFGDRNVAKHFQKGYGLHPSMKKPAVIQDFQNTLDIAHKTALSNGLKPVKVDYKSKEREKEERLLHLAKINTILEKKYIPVHNILKERYGNVVANYMISRTTMIKLANNDITFDEIVYEYRRKLFSDIINELRLEPW